MAKKIVLFADGTGNSFDEQESNIYRIHAALDKSQADQISYYIRGVGTSKNPIYAAWDGATGAGVPSNVRSLYLFLCLNYKRGDEVYMFGFSRGAFTIRTLIGMIASQGLMRPTHSIGPDNELSFSRKMLEQRVEEIYDDYRRDSIAKWERSDVPIAYRAKQQACTIWKSATKQLAKSVNRTKTRLGFLDGAGSALEKVESADSAAEERQGIVCDKCTPPDNFIEFVGLFDTVEAFGVPVDELRVAIDRYIYPISFRNSSMPRVARVARHALSLDDERKTFHPLRIEDDGDEDGATNDRIKEVWFAGAHSDIGGGYPDSALSFVPLNWMLQELRQCTTGLHFRPGALKFIRAAASPFAAAHDPRRGLGTTYRYAPRCTSGIGRSGKSFGIPCVHHSVIDRMVEGADNYAPIPLTQEAHVVYPDGTLAPLISVDAKGQRSVYQSQPAFSRLKGLKEPSKDYLDSVLDLVWLRRANYLALVSCLVFVGLGPFLAGPLERSGFRLWQAITSHITLVSGAAASSSDTTTQIAGFFALLQSAASALTQLVSLSFRGAETALPWFLAWPFTAIRSHPFYYTLPMSGALFLYWRGFSLKSDVDAYARGAWFPASAPTIATGGKKGVGADAASEPPRPRQKSWMSFARGIRKHSLAGPAHMWTVSVISVLWVFLVLFGLVATSVFLVIGINRLIFDFSTGMEKICTPTPAKKLRWLSNSIPSLSSEGFSTDQLCWRSGLAVEKGGAYRLTIEIKEPWFDQTTMTDVNGFESDTLYRAVVQAPLLRWRSAAWFQPIARIGGSGDTEWPLIANNGSAPLGATLAEKCSQLPKLYEDTPEYASNHPKGWREGKLFHAEDDQTPVRLAFEDPLPIGEFETAARAWANSAGEWKHHDGQKGPCNSIFPRQKFVSDFVARRTGELFLFVNDAIPVGPPSLRDYYYRNNTGSATVRLEQAPQSERPYP